MLKIFPRHTVNLSKEVFMLAVKTIKDKQIFDGPYIKEFEREFASYHDVKHALGVFSGRAGLCLALQVLGFKEGEEIILPAFNYYEIPAIIKAFNLKPVFVDADPETFNIDISQVEKHITSRTRAIFVTHAFGQPCEMEPIMDIAKRYNLKVIEDCAHSLGVEYKEKKVGTFGDVGIFSFALGKNIPCFGGGMVITNSDAIWKELNKARKEFNLPGKADFLRIILAHTISYICTHPRIFTHATYFILRILGMFGIILSTYQESPRLLSGKDIGRYQKRMINLQARVGLYQLGRLDSINLRLRENGLLYNVLLKDNEAIKLQGETADMKCIHLYYCFMLKNRNREVFQRRLLKKAIDIERNHLSNCAAFQIFGQSGNIYPVSKLLAENSVDLPNSIYLKKDDIGYIVNCVQEVIKDIKNESS